MAETRTTRMGLPTYSADSDSFSRDDFVEAMGDVDSQAMMFLEGTRTARPAPGVSGRVYTVKGDGTAALNGTQYYDNGTAWTPVGSNSEDVGFRASATNKVPLFAQAFSGSQTANLQEWRASSGVAQSWVTASGGLAVTSNGAYSSFGGSPSSSFRLASYAAGSGVVGMMVQGYVGQTADLEQWRNSSGTVLTRVGPDGTVTAPEVHVTGQTNLDGIVYAGGNVQATGIVYANGGLISSSAVVNGNLTVNAQSLLRASTGGETALDVQGASVQSQSLQRWLSNTGVVLAQVGPTGGGIFPSLDVSGTSLLSAVTVSGAMTANAGISSSPMRPVNSDIAAGISAAGDTGGYAFTGSTLPSVSFVAPPSGTVELHYNAKMSVNGTAATTLSLAPRVKLNAGSFYILSAVDDNALVLSNSATGTKTELMRQSRDLLLTGLTPGSAYTFELWHKREGTAQCSMLSMQLTVRPTP